MAKMLAYLFGAGVAIVLGYLALQEFLPGVAAKVGAEVRDQIGGWGIVRRESSALFEKSLQAARQGPKWARQRYSFSSNGGQPCAEGN